MINGIINVYKEKGFTSHDVVAKLRGILKQKKIGHTGTLDPDAEGVLPVCLGNGTKLCDMLTDKDKTYEAVLLLGTMTDTEDITGTVLSTQEVSNSEEEIKEEILKYVGEYDQIPPMYSALKVNGKKLYELAREGKVIERQSRKVMIHAIDIKNINMDLKEVTMTISCSKGTYIRSLCRDIGDTLGCGGCMKSLVRTKVSHFNIEDSMTLGAIEGFVKEGIFEEKVTKVDDMFLNFDRVVVKEEFSKLIYNGNIFHNNNLIKPELPVNTRQVRVYDYLNQFIGIYEYIQEEQLYKPIKMFL